MQGLCAALRSKGAILQGLIQSDAHPQAVGAFGLHGHLGAEQLKQLTQRWVQGSAGEALKEGSGLGLAIVSEYVRLLGAKVTMQTESPHGLRVSITLNKPL